MKEQKGITLTVLMITVIILAILIGVGVTSGMELIEATKQNKFISELKIVQSRVDIINKEIELGSIAYNDVGQNLNILDSKKTEEINKALTAEGIKENAKSDFKYFSTEELKKIGVSDFKQDVLINFKTKKVISVIGFTVKDKTYYSKESINEQ